MDRQTKLIERSHRTIQLLNALVVRLQLFTARVEDELAHQVEEVRR